jgi:hypothetical protein
VTPDGQRFFVVQQRPAPPLPVVTNINLILNRLDDEEGDATTCNPRATKGRRGG